jgi:WD40 repeat protein
MIWDTWRRSEEAIMVLDEHDACVRGLSWCKWKDNMLATGGGSHDMTLRLWDVGKERAEIIGMRNTGS